MAQVEKEKKRRLFADVSAVQVVATALAAVTSMLLSSYIGIAGSVIGVAVASIVSTLAASLYKKFLADSAEKIKELPVIAKPGETLGQIIPGRHGEGADQSAGQADPAGTSASKPAAADGSQATQALPGGTAAASGPDAANHAEEPPSGEAAGVAAGSIEPSAEAGSGSEVDAVAALRKQRRLVRGLIAVCVVSALLAVAASGAVVYFATMGAGLGTKTTPIYLSAPANSTDQAPSQNASTAPDDAPSSEGDAATDSSSASSSSSASDSSTGSGGSDTGTGTGGDGDAGNTTDPVNPDGDGGSGNTAPGGTAGESGKPAPGAKPAT